MAASYRRISARNRRTCTETITQEETTNAQCTISTHDQSSTSIHNHHQPHDCTQSETAHLVEDRQRPFPAELPWFPLLRPSDGRHSTDFEFWTMFPAVQSP